SHVGRELVENSALAHYRNKQNGCQRPQLRWLNISDAANPLWERCLRAAAISSGAMRARPGEVRGGQQQALDATPRIERVDQAVAEEVEAEHGPDDGEPGEQRHVRRIEQVRAA